MMWVLMMIAVVFLDIRTVRRARNATWIAQIALGDAVAVKRGTFVKRYISKKAHTIAGRTASGRW